MLTDGTEHILCHGVRWHELVFEEQAILGFRSFLCSYIYEAPKGMALSSLCK